MPLVVLMIWVIAGAVIVIMVVMRMIVMKVMAMSMLDARPMIVDVGVAVIMSLCAALGLHIRPTFGIERRLERDHPSPEPSRHRLDHRIAADAQSFRQHFGQEMAIAEVPGDAGHRQRIGGPDLRQRFGLGDHFHHASVLEPQTVAAAEHRRFLEIKQEFEPSDPRHGDPPPIPRIEVQHHRVGRSARPMAGGDDFVGAQHLYTFRLGRPRHWESRAALSEFEREAKQTPAGL
jgi:hypothetical protein